MAKKKRKKRRRRATTAETPSLGRRKKIMGIEFYEVENALETLTRANEIQKDEKLMKATEKLLNKRQEAMDKVAKQIRS